MKVCKIPLGVSKSFWSHRNLPGNEKEGNSSRRLFLHCASSYSSHLYAGVQVGPKGDKMQHSSPSYAAVQGCTPAHCHAQRNTGAELIPLALQGRAISVEAKGGW